VAFPRNRYHTGLEPGCCRQGVRSTPLWRFCLTAGSKHNISLDTKGDGLKFYRAPVGLSWSLVEAAEDAFVAFG
jgi:hypothetical protein